MIKAVLFDLDGTLIDTNNLIIESFKYTYKKHLNIDVKDKEICKYFGEPLLETLKRYDAHNAESLMDSYREFNARNHDKMAKGFDGARETVMALKQLGVKVGIVTSKRKEMTEKGLKLAHLENSMDVIITPEDTDKHKPHPEPILKACEKLNISPEEALYVGDTFFDIMSSREAGSKNCLVKYTALPLDELMLYNPDHAVDKLTDIIRIVEDENRETKVS